MLLNLREYQRPGEDAQPGRQRERLDEALALLARPHLRTVALAGGGALLGSSDLSVDAVVDLQGLGLDEIAVDGPAGQGGKARLRIGAMATRTALAGALPAQRWFGGVLAEGARRWQGSVQRNRATAGGAVAVAAATDPLLVALLVCDAAVALYTEDGPRAMLLAEFLPSRRATLAAPALITDILVPAPADQVQNVAPGPAQGQSGAGDPQAGPAAALAMVGRTPADDPIVVAGACLRIEGRRCAWARLALGGIAAEPRRLPEIEDRLAGQELNEALIASACAALQEAVQPEGDFRGSAEYRRHLARVLGERALSAACERAG
jgi:carbon-monoxide dehydrogenase medium subunit